MTENNPHLTTMRNKNVHFVTISILVSGINMVQVRLKKTWTTFGEVKPAECSFDYVIEAAKQLWRHISLGRGFVRSRYMLNYSIVLTLVTIWRSDRGTKATCAE